MTWSTCHDYPASTVSSAKWESSISQCRNGPRKSTIMSTRTNSEGSGGSDGIVLPMKFTYSGQSSAYDSPYYKRSYTIQVSFGNNGQSLPLQVDTGSSDLWVASTSCPTSTCGAAGGKLYNSNSALQSGDIFDIKYLSGHAAGPIVWDKVQLGGYQINNQALGAVDDVQQEPLDVFSGILGLALPQNSVIMNQIPAATGDAPDGAIFASNLFSIGNGAPAARFLSLSLERPGSDRIPSMLGIGRHPSSVVPDPSVINYSPPFSDGRPPLFWKTIISAITVYVDGVRKDVNLPSGVSGSVLPTAILDTGVPVILATTAIANGIYGALGIGPGADGNFYVPCTTPINMTIVVNGVLIPLHPLDLTLSTNQGSGACLGLIQNDPALMESNIGDLVLGIPFMRNVYMVMAFTPPESNGTFNTTTLLSGTNSDIDPRLGLLSLTDPNLAMNEFHNVRVLGQPLSGTGSTSNAVVSHHGLSMGLKVLIGLVSGLMLLVAIFLVRVLYQRRSRKESHHKQGRTSFNKGGEELGSPTPKDTSSKGVSPEIELTDNMPKEMQFEDLLKRKTISSGYTIDSGRTWTGEVEDDEDEMLMDEFGLVYFAKKLRDRSDSLGSFIRRDTLVGEDDKRCTWSSTRSATAPAMGEEDLDFHSRSPCGGPQVSDRLLASQDEAHSGVEPQYRTVESLEAEHDIGEMGQPMNSMAGIGTRSARRLSRDDFSVISMSRLSRHESMTSPSFQANISSENNQLHTRHQSFSLSGDGRGMDSSTAEGASP